MASPAKIARVLAIGVIAALAVSACSSQSIKLAKDSPYRQGAQLFLTHCSGCHSLALVGADGSASSVQGRLRTQAPNFNFRKEGYACVLYAIENGGFSGEIMPQDIVVGPQAKAVARFLAKFAGREAQTTPTVGGSASCGSGANPVTPPPAPAPPPPKVTNHPLALAANPTGLLAYDAKTLVASSSKVTIDFANRSPVPHNVTIANSAGKVEGATKTFTGGSTTLSLNLPPGTYTFYCSVPGHEQAGMKGTLTVR